MYLLNVAVPPLPGRVHASGAAQPLWQESQSDLCGDCRRSSPTPPATTGTMQWNLRDQEKTTHSNKVCQVFLTSSCPYSLVAHLQPSQSAAILACSCQKGCCCPNPASCRIWVDESGGNSALNRIYGSKQNWLSATESSIY